MKSYGPRIALAILACLLIVGVAYWMNSGYSRISDHGYDYALALVSACARRDDVRVKQIAQEVADSELPDYDCRVILDITEQALDGNWELASTKARQLLTSQNQSAQQL